MDYYYFNLAYIIIYAFIIFLIFYSFQFLYVSFFPNFHNFQLYLSIYYFIKLSLFSHICHADISFNFV